MTLFEEKMQDVQISSTLCKDIFELEKDFRYNLFLLKLRDTEIIRCKTQNDQLLRELKEKERDNADIRIRIRDLETELTTANKEKANSQLRYEQMKNELTKKLEESQKIHNEYIRNQQIQVKKREIELEWMCKSVVEAKEKTHQQEMVEMNDRLQKEICLNQKANLELQTIIKENISLRNEFQEKQSVSITKISILDSELKQMQDEKIKFAMKLDVIQKDCLYFETELKKTITEKDQVKQELSDSDERNRNLRRKLNEISAERDHLHHQLKNATDEHKTCSINLETIKKEYHQIIEQFELYKEQTFTSNNENIANIQNLEQFKVENAKLKLELDTTRNECTSNEKILIDNYEEIKLKYCNLKREFEYYKTQIVEKNSSNYLKNLETLAEHNLKLLAEIEQYKFYQNTEQQFINSLIEKIRAAKEETNNTRMELEYLQQQQSIIENVKKCTIVEHEKIDTIIKQNSILQDVVKSMRRERNEDIIDTQEMESKVAKLEDIVELLKTIIYGN